MEIYKSVVRQLYPTPNPSSTWLQEPWQSVMYLLDRRSADSSQGKLTRPREMTNRSWMSHGWVPGQSSPLERHINIGLPVTVNTFLLTLNIQAIPPHIGGQPLT